MDSWFYGNPRGFAVAVLVILAMGWSAFLTIGRQEDPSITNLFATVLTPYPGADPARVEALVTEKIEAELRGVAAISEISSVSRPGLSVIQIDLVGGAAEVGDRAGLDRNPQRRRRRQGGASRRRREFRTSRTPPSAPSPRSVR